MVSLARRLSLLSRQSLPQVRALVYKCLVCYRWYCFYSFAVSLSDASNVLQILISFFTMPLVSFSYL